MIKKWRQEGRRDRLPGALLAAVLPTRPRPSSRQGNVTVTRLSVANTVTDFSSFVTKVPSDADIVFFPTQKPADAQTFAQQLIEQGKKAKVFGGDGANAPRISSRCRARTSRTSLPGHQHHPVRQGAHRRLAEGQPEAQASARSGLRSTYCGAGCAQRRSSGPATRATVRSRTGATSRGTSRRSS